MFVLQLITQLKTHAFALRNSNNNSFSTIADKRIFQKSKSDLN